VEVTNSLPYGFYSGRKLFNAQDPRFHNSSTYTIASVRQKEEPIPDPDSLGGSQFPTKQSEDVQSGNGRSLRPNEGTAASRQPCPEGGHDESVQDGDSKAVQGVRRSTAPESEDGR